VKREFEINGRLQLVIRVFCVAILCSLFCSASAATVEWHYLGTPSEDQAPPNSLVITPAAPNSTNNISFVAPIDGKKYLNSIAAGDACGNPIISVVSNSHLITVTFTPRLDEFIPNYAALVSGIDGKFGPLAAGTWGFEVFSNSGALISSNSFTVTGPVLGIELAGNQVILSWPALTSNYVLQTATDLSSGSWRNITNGIANNGASFIFTNSIANQTAYFRLQEQ